MEYLMFDYDTQRWTMKEHPFDPWKPFGWYDWWLAEWKRQSMNEGGGK